jgi:hypothetical protein
MAAATTGMQSEQHPWQETTATVISCSYHYAKWQDANLDDEVDHSYFVTIFRYKVNGELFIGEINPDREREEGETFSPLYDPRQPQTNTAEGEPPSHSQRIVRWTIIVLGLAALLFLSHHLGWSDTPELP